MSFCASLRRRSSCSDLIPILQNAKEINLRENNLKTHDIALPFQSAQSQRIYRVLTLTPSATLKKDESLFRIQQFERLSGSVDSGIFFHAPSGCSINPHQSFQDVQYLLLSNGIYLPIFYMPSSESIIKSLKALTSCPKNIPKQPSPPNAAIQLLPYCTIDLPMSQSALTILSDMYPNMKSVASIQNDKEAMSRMVEAGMCKAEAEGCVEFWKQEYLAD